MVSVVSSSHNLYFSFILKFSLFLLALCIFINWLLVKRLTTIPIIESIPAEEYTRKHKLFIDSLDNIKIYGLLQNWFFIVSVILIFISFLFEWNNKI